MAEQGEFRWRLTADDSQYQQATGRVQRAQERLINSTAKLARANKDAFGPQFNSQLEKSHKIIDGSAKAMRELSDSSNSVFSEFSDTSNAASSLKDRLLELWKSTPENFSASVQQVVHNLEGGLLQIIIQSKKAAQGTNELGNALNRTFDEKTQKKLDTLVRNLDRQQEAARKAAREVEDIRRQYAAITDSDVATSSVRKMQTELRSTEREIAQVSKRFEETKQRSLELEGAIEGAASASVRFEREAQLIAANAQAEAYGNTLTELGDKAERLRSSINQVRLNPESSNEAQKTAEKLQTAEEKAERLANEAAGTAEQIAEISNRSEDVAGKTSDIAILVGAVSKGWGAVLKVISFAQSGIKKLTSAVSKFTNNLTKGLTSSNKSATGLLGTVDRLRKRILRLASAALIFNVIRRSFTSLRNYLWAVIQTNDQFIASLASVKGNLLTAFQPIWEAIMPALNALMAALAKVTAYIAAFVSLLFGKTASASQGAAKSLYDQAKALGAVGSAADKAGGKLAAFDEINVLAQDNAAGGGGGADTIVPDFDYDFSGIEEWFKQFESWPELAFELGKNIAEKIADALANIDWNEIQRRARVIASTIANFINGFIATPEFWYQIGRTIAEGLNTAFHFAEQFADDLWWKELGDMIAYGLNAFIDTLDVETAARALYKWVNGIFEAAYAAITGTNWGELGRKLAVFLNDSIAGIDWDLIGRTFGAAWNALVDLIYSIVTNFDWKGLGKSVATAINGLFDEIDWKKTGETINKALVGLLDVLIEGIETLDWDLVLRSIGELLSGLNWHEVMEKVGEAIAAAVSVAKEKFILAFEEAGDDMIKGLLRGALLGFGGNAILWVWKHIVDPIIKGFKKGFEINSPSKVMSNLGVNLIEGLAQGIRNTINKVIQVFTDLWDDIKLKTEEAWENVKKIWEVASDWFEEFIANPILELFGLSWDDIVEFASNAWDNIKEAWDNAPDWFKDLANGIIGFFEGMGNGIISIMERTINWIVDAINKLSFDIPDILGGGKIGFNVPRVSLDKISIPRLATGAVIPPNKEFAAILGDQPHGRNLEAPEGLIRDIIRDELSGVMSDLSEALNGSRGEQSVTVQIDGNAVLTAVINAQERRGRGMIGGRNLSLV